jgi:hypothetical protein
MQKILVVFPKHFISGHTGKLSLAAKLFKDEWVSQFRRQVLTQISFRRRLPFRGFETMRKRDEERKINVLGVGEKKLLLPCESFRAGRPNECFVKEFKKCPK